MPTRRIIGCLSEDYENCKLAANLEALNLSTYAANLEVSALLQRKFVACNLKPHPRL